MHFNLTHYNAYIHYPNMVMKIAQQVSKGGANMKSSIKRIHDKLQNFEAGKL